MGSLFIVVAIVAIVQIVGPVKQSLSLLHEFVGLMTIYSLAFELCASQKLDHPPSKRVALAGEVGERILQSSIGCVIALERLG